VSLFHDGQELPSNVPLAPERFAASPTIVLFNSRIFPQKSYPKVDQAFRFFPSRYQEFVFNTSFAEDFEPSSRSSSESRSAVLREIRRQILNSGNYDASARVISAPISSQFPQLGETESFMEWTREIERLRSGRSTIEDLRAVYGVPEGVEFSNADFQALHRLEALGVDRLTIASVYIACERNEAMAQNCLMAMG
jgi:hypothetical protein